MKIVSVLSDIKLMTFYYPSELGLGSQDELLLIIDLAKITPTVLT